MDYESNMELTSSDPVVEKPTTETLSEVVPEVKMEETENPTPETPEEVKAEPTLYETPDGRKVDADTLQREWKENFLPEFTRKSQRLAEIDREKELSNPENDIPAWKKDDYVPANYAEVIELAKKEAIQEIHNTYQAEQARVTAVQQEVDKQLAEIKKTDPKLDESSLFVHANKYGFHDLKAAHSNMVDMKKALVDVEQRTVKNLKTREADPISTVHGGELSESSGYDPKEMSQFDGAADYLEFIKGKK